jgi:hypothetical protein
VSRARSRSSGSSRLAAFSSNAGASAPAPGLNAICPRSRSHRARWNSSGSLASAVASNPRAVSNASACRAACAAESAVRTPRWFRCQFDGALQERGGGEPAAGLRSVCRLLELQGDLFIGSQHRRSEMPGATVRIDVCIRRFRQRQMDRPPFLWRH